MNFEEFKAIMCDLEKLNYVKIKEYKDHCFVLIEEQADNETRDFISKKIIDIWENSGIIGGYKIKGNVEFIFVKTDDFIKCFEEENYEKIAKQILELNPSFIAGYTVGAGVNKKISLYCHNEFGNEYGFENAIYKIIRENLPKDAYMNNTLITTTKGKEWEKKKRNCAEIKICEDFDEILSRY